ncbi:MAG: enamine deaminase RidA [Acidimicrobiaceae bacterium]|nr:enamine deaminase RidA [Actinomycetota bacterium]MBC85523.1 enamine deaminase RidA [Acidimicrobiaceae bacterium]MBE33278.1 enamine deaminase RidA [bacterium]|tara:strand:+ start:287 stop:664 length:378 start_codon:yes stop_codon:yes gene_type:complete
MDIIDTELAAKPLGHYSQAIVHNGLVYVSGQLPIDPNDESRFLETVEDQTLQTLKNVQAVLAAANSDKSLVLKATVYISDISIWAQVNQVYTSFFGDHLPARSAVPTKNLPKGYLVEIDVIAAQK